MTYDECPLGCNSEAEHAAHTPALMTDNKPVPLLPCPFCGKNACREEHPSGDVTVGCPDVFCPGYMATDYEDRDNWNRRAVVRAAWRRVMRDMWLAWRSGEKCEDYAALNAEVESLLAASPPPPAATVTPEEPTP